MTDPVDQVPTQGYCCRAGGLAAADQLAVGQVLLSVVSQTHSVPASVLGAAEPHQLNHTQCTSARMSTAEAGVRPFPDMNLLGYKLVPRG